MSKKNKTIIGLLIIAVIVFCSIVFFIVPTMQQEQSKYIADQTDALTHDISSIEEFRNPYVGNAPNTGNLFYTLPLNNVSMKFQIDSEDCTLTVSYLDTIWAIGEEKIHRDLVYNSIAAMAAIDNLTEITYELSDVSFSFSRQEIEDIFGAPLSDLLDNNEWKDKVQDQMGSSDFIGGFYSE